MVVIMMVLILVVVVGGRWGMVVVDVLLLKLAVGPVRVRWGRRNRSRVMTTRCNNLRLLNPTKAGVGYFSPHDLVTIVLGGP